MLRYRPRYRLVTASLPPRYRPRYRARYRLVTASLPLRYRFVTALVTALVTAPEKKFRRKLLPQIKVRGNEGPSSRSGDEIF